MTKFDEVHDQILHVAAGNPFTFKSYRKSAKEALLNALELLYEQQEQINRLKEKSGKPVIFSCIKCPHFK